MNPDLEHSYAELNDEELMRRVSAGEKLAFELLYDRYAASVMGQVLKMLQDTGRAEEAVLETFWQIWSQAYLFQLHPAKFVDWLRLTAHREATRIRQQNHRS